MKFAMFSHIAWPEGTGYGIDQSESQGMFQESIPASIATDTTTPSDWRALGSSRSA